MNTDLLPEPVASAGDQENHDAHDELARIAERVLEIPQPDTPRLEIHREGCRVSITWRGTEENFRLEISDHAYVHGDWRPVAEAVSVAGGIHRVLLPGAAHVRYVRLARNRPGRGPRLRVTRTATTAPAARRPANVAQHRAATSEKPEGMELLPVLVVLATVAAFMLRQLVAGL
jgi:hypothetical protein